VEAEAFALALAREVRERVAPLLGAPESRERRGTARGGDPTYQFDAVAEGLVHRTFEAIDDAVARGLGRAGRSLAALLS
jgi:fructose-1,6-bisphosphatase/inositol monophosphatase family enzyme